MKSLFALTFMILFSLNLWSQEGYEIEIELLSYDKDTLFLAYYHGDSQFMQDTTTISNGKFIFSGEEPLKPGMYMVVREERSFFQLLIDENEMHFSMTADNEEVAPTVQLENAPQNEAFFGYMTFLQNQRKEGDVLREQLETAEGEEREEIEDKLRGLDQAVKDYQWDLVEKFEGDLLGAIIRANIDPEVPEFDGTDEEVRQKKFEYYKEHFFDNFDFNDERLLRSPILSTKFNQYIDQMTSRSPDSIAKSIDLMLSMMEDSDRVFRFFLANSLNKYAQSKIIGMDAVYVHLIDKYYATGKAWWVGEEQLERIMENADRIRPTLIGKTAADITVEKRDGQRVRLHSLDYDYTILYFWRPDCGHCRRYTPQIVEFIKEFEEKGVGVVTICTKFTDDVESCWEYIDRTDGTDHFLNLVDPFHRSRFTQHFNVRTTPLIYVLDSDKKIISKRLSAQQLPEVLPVLMRGRDTAGQLTDTTPGE